MALVCQTIRSVYLPPTDNDILHENTSDGDVETPSIEDWDLESSFLQRRIRYPNFVPATTPSTNEATSDNKSSSSRSTVDASSTETASWYRSLVTQSSSPNPTVVRQAHLPLAATQNTAQPKRQRAVDRNSWFIRRVIPREDDSGRKTSLPEQSLADMLSKDPPNVQDRVKPHAWLAIGPSNKGYEMLERSGWTEGEGLGARVLHRARPKAPEASFTDSNTGPEVIEVLDSDEEDLPTLPVPVQSAEIDPYEPKALLRPLATVLKTDRLGLGLKAKTEGPHKAPVKRITHNRAALAAHLKASSEARKKKQQMGRGARGFQKIKRAEEADRKHMLAYMND